jgi:hypothetical protein
MLPIFLRASFLPRQCRCVQYRYLSVTPLLTKGHSKWQNIKATKGKNDAEKAKKMAMFMERLKKVIKAPGGFDMKLNRELEKLQLEYRKQSLPIDTFNNRLAKLKVSTFGSLHLCISYGIRMMLPVCGNGTNLRGKSP